jgi:hypothetical protein
MVDNSKIEQKYRTIRSYVIRGVRMTDAQQNAFSIHWPRWGLSADEGLIDFDPAPWRLVLAWAALLRRWQLSRRIEILLV